MGDRVRHDRALGADRFACSGGAGDGALILATHDLLDNIHASAFAGYGPFWCLLHEPGPLPFGVNGRVYYPALPWIGVVAVGYGLGPLFLADARRREWILSLIGVAALALFVILRGSNLYGDLHPWSPQPTPTMTALSFLNVNKYPPSLLYALVTLGPAVMLLPVLERLGGASANPRRFRSDAAVFLCLAPLRRSWRGHGARIGARLQPGGSGGFRRQQSAAGKFRRRPPWGLCRLDRDCRGALPALPLVRALQTTPARLVDHLLVSAARQRKCQHAIEDGRSDA